MQSEAHDSRSLWYAIRNFPCTDAYRTTSPSKARTHANPENLDGLQALVKGVTLVQSRSLDCHDGRITWITHSVAWIDWSKIFSAKQQLPLLLSQYILPAWPVGACAPCHD